jgi:hypothetical protein
MQDYFWKVFHKYYNLICIFICTPICTKILILAKSGCYTTSESWDAASGTGNTGSRIVDAELALVHDLEMGP